MVLRHDVGLEPYTHRVVGTHDHHIAHTVDTLHLGDNVDLHVVLDEFLRVLAAGVIEGHADKH